MDKYETDAGDVMTSREFWAFVVERREAGRRLEYAGGALRDPEDGTWYWPGHMTPAERDLHRDELERSQWWAEHKRDVSVIPSLSDGDLVQFRLLADIRADIRVLNAAAEELWRRGIRDYPIAT